MKRIILALLTCGLVLALAAPNAMGTNEVVVESKAVATSATGVTIGVHVENDVELSGIVVPLELREVTAGSYITTSFNFKVQGRVGSSGLTDFPTSRILGVPLPPDSNLCSGPVSRSYALSKPVDYVSPDGVLWVGVVTFNPYMEPGNDGLPGVGTPSFLFTFNVTGVDGFFEIDTMCVTPANHLQFVDGFYMPITPSFTKGTVTIGTPPPPNTFPVAVCTPGGINTPTGLCERASIDPSMIDGGSYDDDAGDTITLSVYPAGPYGAGVHDIWLVATDTHGAADTCQTTLTVVDDEDPVVTCPGDIVQGNDTDECGAIVTWDPATATDNCDIDSVYCDPPSGFFFQLGTTPVTCIAVDMASRADTCTFNVTVEDAQFPTVYCQNDTTVMADSDSGAVISYGFGGSDNCPGVTITKNPEEGFFPLGATLVTVIAEDVAGNADTCTFTVTVTEVPNEPPTAVCQAVSVGTAPGRCDQDVAASAVNNGSSDPEDGTNLILTLEPVGPYPVGQTPVSLIVEDSDGARDTCQTTITVEDNESPVVSCPGDTTVSNDGDECGAIVEFNYSASDNCGVSAFLSHQSGDFFPVGKTEVMIRAEDVNGNADTCYFNITVEDNQAPVIAGCPVGDYEVSNDPGQCGATLSFDGVITADDNCDPDVTLTGVPIDQFFAIGTTPVTVTATDDAGNEKLCEFNVVVTDDELPTPNCPKDTTVIVGPLETEAVVTWTSTVDDNCPGATITCAPPSGSTFPVGPTLVTCTAVDDAGNQDQCTFTVTVSSQLVPPVALCTDVNVVAGGPWDKIPNPACLADASIDNGSYDPDGGPVTLAQVPPGPYVIGQTLVRLLVTDDEGDTASCEATVTVVDETPPTITCVITEDSLPADGDCQAFMPDYTVADPNVYTAEDACDVTLDIMQVPAQGEPLGLGTYDVMLIAVDDAGNADTCGFTFEVVDNTAPIVDCGPPMTLAVDDNCEALVPDASQIVVVDDNCTLVELIAITQDPIAGTPLPPGGPYMVNVLATDEAGNSTPCVLELFVEDTIPPTITCPGDVTIPNDLGQCGAMWDGYATAVDNCALDYVLCNPIIPPVEKNGGWFLPIGQTTFECLAVDIAGNQATCTYTVTVEDTEPPYLQCPTELTESTCDPAGAMVWWNEPFYGDNCGVVDAGCDPAPGSLFPVGVTTVICWMEDYSGNRDSCFFDVTVTYDPPRFVATPDTLWFTADCAENPDSQCVTVDYDQGNCPIDKIGDLFWWYAYGSEPWITVNPQNGEAPGGTFCVNLAASTLPPGNYEGLVHVVESNSKPVDGNVAPDSVVIILTVNDIGFDQIVVSEDTLYFDIDFDHYLCEQRTVLDSVWGVCDDKVVDSCWQPVERTEVVCRYTDDLCQTITLTNEGCGETCWQLFDDPAGWITVNPTGGTTPDDVEICVDPCNLMAGEYIDTLIFCVCPDKDPKVPGCAAVLVKMRVINPPVLMVDPTHLVFNEAIPGDHSPKPVDILNMGGGFLMWSESHLAPWLQVGPSDGMAPGVMNVGIDFGSLMGPDTLRDTIMVSAECALFSPMWVIVDVILPCDDICGQVMLADDGAATGAIVQAWTNWPDGSIISDAVVDVDGFFCLSGLGTYDGPFDIRIVYQGYCPQVIEDVACGAADFEAELEPIPFTANPAWPFFADYWSVNAQVFGVPLMPGDVILAMDPDGVLCGVTTVKNAGEYLVHVLGDDPNTPGDEGAEPGDPITLLLNCSCPAIAPDPWMDQGNFQFDVNFECDRRTIECSLCYPWNLLSINVIPTDPSLAAVLNSIDGKYDRAYSATCDDGSLSWELGRPINDLTAINHMHGFGLRVTEPDLTLTLTGYEFPVQSPLGLCMGWNLIPYWPEVGDTLGHALASIAGLYEQIIGFECDGAHTWVAGRPINDLFCLEPCNGYWIKMTQAATLTYPVADYSCGVADAGPLPKAANRIDRLNVTPYQADFWSISDPTLTGVVDGDVITAYTIDGTLCGEAVVGAAGAFLMHVYGDDPSTALVEGAVDGERMAFRVNGEPASVVDGSAVWSDRGSNQVALLLESAAASLPTEYALLQNYPNPFNAGTAIRFNLKRDADVNLVIYNVLGQVVRDLYNGHLTAGEHTLTWNGKTDEDRSAQSGVYFYRIATSDWTDVKKMTLMK